MFEFVCVFKKKKGLWLISVCVCQCVNSACLCASILGQKSVHVCMYACVSV